MVVAHVDSCKVIVFPVATSDCKSLKLLHYIIKYASMHVCVACSQICYRQSIFLHFTCQLRATMH